MAITKVEFEKQERAIELPDGTILDIPERTKANDDKIQAVLQTRTSTKEYDFLVKFLEAMFGKDGFKQIAPDLKNANMDYLTAVYLASLNAFYEDKNANEQAEMERRASQLDAITDRLEAINPLVHKIK